MSLLEAVPLLQGASYSYVITEVLSGTNSLG
jgi:hypothetical protein